MAELTQVRVPLAEFVVRYRFERDDPWVVECLCFDCAVVVGDHAWEAESAHPVEGDDRAVRCASCGRRADRYNPVFEIAERKRTAPEAYWRRRWSRCPVR